MQGDTATQESPKGSTYYFNYNPDNIHDVGDAVELFRWLAEMNRDKDKVESASVYDDCAGFLERELVD